MKNPLDVQVAGDHYKTLKIQPIEYIHANGIPFAEGSVIKYVTRWRAKGGVKDLEKARHFLDLLIELEMRAALQGGIGAALVGPIVAQNEAQVSPLVFLRPGELRTAEWAEFDLDAAEWRVPASKMKMKVEHIVPLSSQAVAILRDMHPLTGHGRYVFPGLRTGERPMSENTINAALRGMGYSQEVHTAHGFRAMARTIMDEVLGERVDLIEHQLAHAVKDTNGRAYNRTKHLPARREMMQRWADYLDTIRKTSAPL